MSEFDFVGADQQAVAQREQFRENSARQATSQITYTTRGAGQIVLADPLRFDTTFLREPAVTTGAVIDRVPDERYWFLPRAQVSIMRWERNTKGYYVGAWCCFMVDCPSRPVPEDEDEDSFLRAQALSPPSADVTHHLTFRAIAYKALNDTLFEE